MSSFAYIVLKKGCPLHFFYNFFKKFAKKHKKSVTQVAFEGLYDTKTGFSALFRRQKVNLGQGIFKKTGDKLGNLI
jgi:hypothetical protein